MPELLKETDVPAAAATATEPPPANGREPSGVASPEIQAPARPTTVARIGSVAMALPDTVVTNEQVAERLGVEPGWIVKRTGIRERRATAPSERLSDLAARAGARRPRASGPRRARTSTWCSSPPPRSDELTPNAAPLVAHELGAGQAAAMDIGAACTAFISALAVGGGPDRDGSRPHRARDRHRRAAPVHRRGRSADRRAVRGRRRRGDPDRRRGPRRRRLLRPALRRQPGPRHPRHPRGGQDPDGRDRHVQERRAADGRGHPRGARPTPASRSARSSSSSTTRPTAASSPRSPTLSTCRRSASSRRSPSTGTPPPARSPSRSPPPTPRAGSTTARRCCSAPSAPASSGAPSGRVGAPRWPLSPWSWPVRSTRARASAPPVPPS